GDLTILCRPADRVDEADKRVREPAFDEIDDMPNLDHRLRRLCGNADPRVGLEPEHVVVFEDDVEAVQVAGQTAHFDVPALTDDDRVITVAHERAHRLVRDVYQRAGRFHDVEPLSPGLGQCALGYA